MDADHRPGDIAALIGQRVAVTGIYSHVSGLRRQLRYAIRVANPDDIRVLDVRTDPFDVADVRETDLFRARDGQLAVRRKATGRVLTVWGGHNLLLRTDGGDLVRGELAEPRLPSRGDRIVLAGLQETDLYSAILTRAIWQPLPRVNADADGARRHLALASKTLAFCRSELRQCLWDLRSRALEAPTTARALARTLEPYVLGLDLNIRFNVPRKEIPDAAAHALLRIVRELVLNAIRHGQATSVRIDGRREGDRILFSVSDNGCGFDPKVAPGIRQGHFGLQGVRERLRLFRGQLTVESRPGAGAKIMASLELPPDTKGTSPCPNQPRS